MLRLPPMVKIKQHLPRPQVEDVAAAVGKELEKLALNKKIAGKTIAITGGSRGITGIDKIYRQVVEFIKEKGGSPLLVSAMGSHGGGTGPGQRTILTHLGVTEEKTGCPIAASAEVIKLGYTPTHQVAVYCAREAVEADGIIVINRIKAHTAFRAPRESGLLKMLAIGLGRAPGAEAIHSQGPEVIGDIILELSRIVREKTNVLAGLAIVENGYEETALLQGLRPEQFEEEEAKLLKYAKGLMPTVPFEQLDLLLIDEMGKNFSGTGMDTNVIGRWRIHGVAEAAKPLYQRIAVLDLTAASHGNANGVGLADFITKRLFAKIDYQTTYLNCLTTGFVQRGMIPVILNSHREIIEAALKTLHLSNPENAKIVRIKNTLFLDEMYCSISLLDEIQNNSNLEVIVKPREMEFDENNNFIRG
ncbi:MAG: DUF362 domain-containing protein [Peptococcaceae bacterium]